ncbi:YadA-like family protein [Escherichia fergusonii]|uniref:YadA-like family protein n=1 Tax=Escherichia fergusonii TaxID=564 RepID=UPI0015EB024B|nr:YadA-like family protein [Escherichia fergusonii]QMJ71822.1 YadA-like family protein [Escherichia fergusonii]QMJ76282.1 YadA-like family protein [Escherichia fergusonii]
MNKIFKVIWNPATGSYSVASETAKSRGKKSGRSKLLISALVAGGLLSSFNVWANAGNDNGQGIGTGTGWVAIGEGAKANAFTDGNGASTAVGYKSNAQGAWSSAIGALTSAIGDASMAFGVNAISTGQRSIAMGASSSSLGEFSIALGRYASSGGKYSVAQGDKSNAAGLNATAVGSNSNAAGEKATALGNAAKATEIMSIALGDTANASKEYSMALGASSVAAEANAIAVGRNSVANGTDSLALGRQSLASAANAIAMGADTEAAENATAIGNSVKAKGTNSMALGSGSLADKTNTIALGNGSQALADSAIAIGQGSKANGTDAIVLGNGSQSSGLNSIALGKASAVTGDNSLALGSNTTAYGINAVALGAGSIADLDDSVSVGNDSLKRKIVNVKNGTIKADSNDAINGSQLYAISDSVAKRLGGGASVNVDDGTVKAPAYNLKNGNKNNVGDALTVLDENTLQWDQTNGKYSAAHGNNTTSKITNVTAGDLSATSTDAVNGSQLKATKDDVAANTTNISNLTDAVDGLNDDALLWNGTAFSAAHGTNATSKITNVAAGDLSATSTDAVNGSQLKATKDDVAANTTNISNLTDAVDGLNDDALLWNGTAFSAAHGTNATSKITNVAAGDLSATSTDAVNGSQLKATNDDVEANTTNITNLTDAIDGLNDDALLWNGTAFSAAHGTNATSKITNVAAGDLSATSTDAVNGSQLKATNDDVEANTTNITNLTDAIDGLNDDALLWNGTAFSAAHGTNATSKITNVAAGDLSATSTDAVNGSQLKATNDDVEANTTNITNLTDAIDGLNDDALLWNGTAFSAAHGTNATSKITNVAAGEVSSSSTDAINGGQLYGLSSSVASYLGGNASVDANGAFTGPSYTINGTSYTSVGDALTAINTSIGTSLGDALLWDNTAGHFSAAHGSEATSKITNVKAGDLTDTSTDAVNGSQLKATNDDVAANTTDIATNTTNITNLTDAVDSLGDDSLLWDSVAGAFSAAHGTDATAKITNVAAGELTDTSTDAVNGSQLKATNDNVAANTTNIATNTTNISNLTDAVDSLGDDALLWDSTTGAFSAAHGTDVASKITNVAVGTLSDTSTDAVNGSQLYATNMLVTQNSAIINQLAGNTNSTYIEENGAGINYVRTNDSGLTFTDASAAGIGSTAVGYNSVAKGDSSVAIGQGSYSNVDTGIALGSSSVSKREIVKGSRDTSVSEKGVVIGYDTTDGELLGALSIGDEGKYRQIINVADGSEAHDAVTVRQLQNAIGAVATTATKYYHANSTEEDSLAVGTDSLAMGVKTIVNGDKGIGIGYGAYVEANALNGIAIGSNAQVIHVNSIAIGNGSTTTRGAQTNYTAYNMDAPQNSVGEFSVGNEDGQRQITNVAAGSADTDAVNVGQLKVTDERVAQNTQSITNLNTQVTNLDTRVTNIENGIGDIVTTGSTKYFKTNTDGVDANAQGKDSVAIGSGSIAAADNSVALGTGSVATEENTISVGSSTNQRRITNVAAGKNDTDAVNVAQLKSSEAGGVRYDTKADGSVDYSNITLGGSSGGTTRISNVSAGVNNNDAVNYAQLKQSVQENKQYTDQRMAQMDHKLSKTESKLSGGIASAMAMTGLPQAYEPGANMASIGGGTYNGESAVALGVSMVSDNGRWVYKLQGSTNSQGDYSAAIGAGIQW